MQHYQDKYFEQDKNSILRAAQGFVEPQLLKRWVEVAYKTYMLLENPLGLEDAFIIKLKGIKEYDYEFLQELYEILSAIYRYERGNNQLEIIWDGRSHYEVYAEAVTPDNVEAPTQLVITFSNAPDSRVEGFEGNWSFTLVKQ